MFKWNAGEQVTAAAYDNPIPGFGTRNCINLRLWAAKPSKEFDLEAFNTGRAGRVGEAAECPPPYYKHPPTHPYTPRTPLHPFNACPSPPLTPPR